MSSVLQDSASQCVLTLLVHICVDFVLFSLLLFSYTAYCLTLLSNKTDRKLDKSLLQREQQRISVECKKNPKLFWQYVNKKNKSNSAVGTLKWIDSNGSEKLAEKDDEKASALQEFFSNVYTVEKDVNFNNLPSMLADSCSQMSPLVLTKDDVDKKLIHLKTEKSPRPDKLHPRVLYETHSVIAYPLFLIYS